MKKAVLTFLLGSYCSALLAQYAPFPTMDSLDINNLHPAVLVHGDMWWDPKESEAKCSIYGSRRHVNFAGSIWMGGMDAGGSLHQSAQTYRQTGNDYWPGPLETTSPIAYAQSKDWAKIWKVNGTDVQAFNAITTHTILNTPEAILTWPANGNVFARGNGGAALNVSGDMAPFVDLNGNGVYEPLLGDHPDFPGDQALWWIFNDNGPDRDTLSTNPMGVEVHCMSYGYKRGTLLDNVVYYDFKVVNRSANDYHDMRIGIWDDMDLGWYYDDFIGFDSSRRLGIGYNGIDGDGSGGGHPVNSYGYTSPMVGITLISVPGDAGTSYVPAGAFTTYNNDYSIVGLPRGDTARYNLLHGCKLYSGSGFPQGQIPDSAYKYHKYIFTGAPEDPNGWSECGDIDMPSDRRFILSTNDLTLPASTSQRIVFAMVVTDTGVGGCPNATFAKIREVSDTAWAGHNNPPTSLHKHNPTTGGTEVSAYPNPAKDRVFVTGADNASITVYNAMGQAVNVGVVKNGTQYELDVSALPKGVYNAVYHNDKTQGTYKFLKE